MASRMFMHMYSERKPMQRAAALHAALNWPKSKIDPVYVTYRFTAGHFEQAEVKHFSNYPLDEALNLLESDSPIQVAITSHDLIFRMEFITAAYPESINVAWTNRGFAELGEEGQQRFMTLLATLFKTCGATCGVFADESVEYMEDYVTVDGNRILVDTQHNDGFPLHIRRIWVQNYSDIEFIRGQENFSVKVRVSEEILELSRPVA